MGATPRWKKRPPGSKWGDFGPEDQLGRINFIGPEQVRKGVAEVREGKCFCLSLPLDLPGGNVLHYARFPPRLEAVYDPQGRPRMNYPMSHLVPEALDFCSAHKVTLTLQYSTHWHTL